MLIARTTAGACALALLYTVLQGGAAMAQGPGAGAPREPLRGAESHAGGQPADRTEANRRIVREAFEAWRDGAGPITGLFAPEMVWRIEGRSLASGEYRRSRQFIDEVLAPFAARFPASAPFRPVTIRSVHVDGDMAVVVWDGRGIANDGKPYENSYVWLMTLRDGRVVQGTAFYDSIAFNDLWTRVQPRS
jgi:hypothetical protein